MSFKRFCWSLSFVFSTITMVFSHEEYFYKIFSQEDNLETNIITLSNSRIKRGAEPLISIVNTTSTTTQHKNSSIQTIVDKNNGTKTTKVPSLSNTSFVLKDVEKIFGSNITSVNNEPPIQGSSGNISYIVTPQPIDFDFPSSISSITNETLENNNITKTKNDSHIYYNSSTIHDKNLFNNYWVDLENHPNGSVHEMLSDSHRRAATINLKFQFPFYGHLINSTTVATGGFLYLGDYIHSWLAATQYIAPLMANFDFSTSNESNIYYMDNETALTVTWHNAILQDKPKAGGFTFQTTLHSNGNIVFAYKHLPIQIREIDSALHPVKIGLSDAYVLDKTIFFVRRKTIYEYHRVSFDEDEVANQTVIILTALSTCLEKKNCSSCIKKDTNFQCFWCDNRCSNGMDRNRQDWHKKDCEKLKLINEDMCTTGITTLAPPIDNYSVESVKSESHTSSSSSSTSLFFIALCVSLVIMSLVWILYAYLNPHTRSGQMLIKYRPNQWGWRKGEARYTAATIHM